MLLVNGAIDIRLCVGPIYTSAQQCYSFGFKGAQQTDWNVVTVLWEADGTCLNEKAFACFTGPGRCADACSHHCCSSKLQPHADLGEDCQHCHKQILTSHLASLIVIMVGCPTLPHATLLSLADHEGSIVRRQAKGRGVHDSGGTRAQVGGDTL